MNIKIYLCFTIALKITTANNWTLVDEGKCFYTVISPNPSAITIDKISMCNYVEPYVTLIIANSTNSNVTSDFLITTFNPWVRIIKAIDNTWTTVCSFAFSDFKNVQYIDLSVNHIKNINTAFKGLEVLDFLNLSRNQIEMINSATFTISENRTKLHLLDLSNNLLTYLPEKIFENIPNLTMLYLQGNKLSTFEDEFFRYLKSLVYLNLCCNKLTMSNTTMKYLNSLTDLDLSFNNISHINSYTFSGLVSLQTLDLSHNNITDLPLDFLAQSISLMNVNLSYNKLKNMSREIKFSNIDLFDVVTI